MFSGSWIVLTTGVSRHSTGHWAKYICICICIWFELPSIAYSGIMSNPFANILLTRRLCGCESFFSGFQIAPRTAFRNPVQEVQTQRDGGTCHPTRGTLCPTRLFLASFPRVCSPKRLSSDLRELLKGEFQDSCRRRLPPRSSLFGVPRQVPCEPFRFCPHVQLGNSRSVGARWATSAVLLRYN